MSKIILHGFRRENGSVYVVSAEHNAGGGISIDAIEYDNGLEVTRRAFEIAAEPEALLDDPNVMLIRSAATTLEWEIDGQSVTIEFGGPELGTDAIPFSINVDLLVGDLWVVRNPLFGLCVLLVIVTVSAMIYDVARTKPVSVKVKTLPIDLEIDLGEVKPPKPPPPPKKPIQRRKPVTTESGKARKKKTEPAKKKTEPTKTKKGTVRKK